MSENIVVPSSLVLLPVDPKSLEATYYPTYGTLSLSAKGEYPTIVHDIHFIRNPVKRSEYMIMGWTGGFPVVAPWEKEESFRVPQPTPLQVEIVTQNGTFPVKVEIVIIVENNSTIEKPAPVTTKSDHGHFAPGPVRLPTSSSSVYTYIGGEFTIKEPIKGGSVNAYYDRDYLDLMHSKVNNDTMHYTFKARQFGRTMVTIFRSDREPSTGQRIVDVDIFLPPIGPDSSLFPVTYLEKTERVLDYIRAKYADAELLSVAATPILTVPVDSVSRLVEYKLLCSINNKSGKPASLTAVSHGGSPPWKMVVGPSIVGLDAINLPLTDLISAEAAQEAVAKKSPGVEFFSVELSKPGTRDPSQPLYDFAMENGTTVVVGAKDGKIQD